MAKTFAALRMGAGVSGTHEAPPLSLVLLVSIICFPWLPGLSALLWFGGERAGKLHLRAQIEKGGEGIGKFVGAVFENEGDDVLKG